MENERTRKIVYLHERNWFATKTTEEATIIQDKMDSVLVLASMLGYEIKFRNSNTFMMITFLRVDSQFELLFRYGDSWLAEVTSILLTDEFQRYAGMREHMTTFYNPLDKLVELLRG